MTTFTLQDLSNGLPTTPEEDEAFKQMENIGMREMFAGMGQDLTGKVPVMNISDGGRTVQYQTAPNATTPQPSGENPHNSQVSPEAVIDEMLFTIKQSLLLLSTVISQSKAQPEGGENSLQECVSTTLEQADWFTDMVKEEVERRVESEVETYFERRFSPEDHFDFGDAISNEVDDRLDDVVRDRLDEAVEEQLGEVVAERLKNIRVVFD